MVASGVRQESVFTLRHASVMPGAQQLPTIPLVIGGIRQFSTNRKQCFLCVLHIAQCTLHRYPDDGLCEGLHIANVVFYPLSSIRKDLLL